MRGAVTLSVYPLLRLDILNRFNGLQFITAVSQSIEMFALKAFLLPGRQTVTGRALRSAIHEVFFETA